MQVLLPQKDRNWKLKNITLLLISFLIFFYLADTALVKNFIIRIGNLGYLGAFITGIFFVSTFTVAPAAVVLYRLADRLDPFEIAILAGMGAVLGDYTIFRFLKDRVFEELKPYFKKVEQSEIGRIFKTPYFGWLMPVIGAFIIASPLPDELGIGILGATKMKNWQFIILSFLLNAVGIFIIVSLAQLF